MPLDVYDDNPEGRSAAEDNQRPYIGILFECCGVYARVYRRIGERVYHARCPRCLRAVHVHVAPHGTSDRLFRAH